MKDPIVSEIHRYRAAHTKRFNYDIHAIGEDIRRSEAESGGKFVTWARKRKCMGEGRRLKLLAANCWRRTNKKVLGVSESGRDTGCGGENWEMALLIHP